MQTEKLKPVAGFRGWRDFMRHGYRSFTHTGALAPSSRWLVRKLVQPLLDVRRGGEPLNVLEAGAGNGAASHHIARLLRPGDRFTLVEINSAFTAGLRDWIASEHMMQLGLAEVRLVEGAISTVAASAEFDVILSGLPHKNFGLKGASDTFDWYFDALKPGGTLAFFRYAHLPRSSVDKMILDRYHTYGAGRVYVPLNIPPAWVCYMRKP
ncbi:MAG: hypothetical protein DLM55_07605 [Acidimicrobiales bacterium]|nr:MAG: hypothetical protein DLM55_07605 [Acidimicrobiales bacterium]